MLTAPASLPGSGRSWTGAAAEALAGQRAGPGSYNSVVTVFMAAFPSSWTYFMDDPKWQVDPNFVWPVYSRDKSTHHKLH